MIIPLGENFQKDWVMEEKTLQEVPNSEILDDFR
jgi:hypothetical protein